MTVSFVSFAEKCPDLPWVSVGKMVFKLIFCDRERYI